MSSSSSSSSAASSVFKVPGFPERFERLLRPGVWRCGEPGCKTPVRELFNQRCSWPRCPKHHLCFDHAVLSWDRKVFCLECLAKKRRQPLPTDDALVPTKKRKPPCRPFKGPKDVGPRHKCDAKTRTMCGGCEERSACKRCWARCPSCERAFCNECSKDYNTCDKCGVYLCNDCEGEFFSVEREQFLCKRCSSNKRSRTKL